MRNMSFSMTTDQMRRKAKTVTRRMVWKNLEIEDRVRAVVKARGLRKGETVEPIGVIKIESLWWEPLRDITDADVVREGYHNEGRDWFIEKFCKAMKCTPLTMVHRIGFAHLNVCACCSRGDEYNGYPHESGPPLFRCDKKGGCPCHD